MGISTTEYECREAFIFLGKKMPIRSNEVTRNMSLRDALDHCRTLGCHLWRVNSNDYHVAHPMLMADRSREGLAVSVGRKDASAALVVFLRNLVIATEEYRESHPDEVEDTKAAPVQRAVMPVVAPTPPPPVRAVGVTAEAIEAHFQQVASFLHYQSCCSMGEGMLYVPFEECKRSECKVNRKMLSGIKKVQDDLIAATSRAEQAEAEAEAKINEAVRVAEALVEEHKNRDKAKLTQGTANPGGWYCSFKNELTKSWKGPKMVRTRFLLVCEELFHGSDAQRDKLQACVNSLDFGRLHGHFSSHTKPGNKRKTFGISAWQTLKTELARMERKRRL